MIYDYMALTRPEICDIVAHGKAIAVLPIGSIEQHGPHLPLGTDSYTAAYYAREFLKKVHTDVDFLVLPQLFYALSVEHITYPTTISLKPETLLNILRDIGEALKHTGFKKLMIINGHGGNDHLLEVVAREIHKLGIQVFIGSYIAVAGALGIDPLAVHACKVETSIMMEIHPELVRHDKITPELDKSAEKWLKLCECHSAVSETWFAEEVAVDGVIGEPTKASLEIGRDWVGKLTDELAKGIAYMLEKN